MTRGLFRAVPLLALLLFVHAPAAQATGPTAGNAYCKDFSIIGDYQPPGAMPLIGNTWLLFTCGDAGTVPGGPWGLTVNLTIKTPANFIGLSAPTLYHGDGLTQAALAGPFSIFRSGNYFYEWQNTNAPGVSGEGTSVSSCGLKVDVEVLLGVGVKPNGQPNNAVLGTAKDVVAGCSGNGAVVEGTAPQIEAARKDVRIAIKDLEKADHATSKAQAIKEIAASKRESLKAKSLWDQVQADPTLREQVLRDFNRALSDDNHMEMIVEEDKTFTPSEYAPQLTNDDSNLRLTEQVM